MSVMHLSRVCDCGKGYRSRHDLKCGHCRGKSGELKLRRYFLELEAAERRLQLEHFRHYTHSVGGPYGTLIVETV